MMNYEINVVELSHLFFSKLRHKGVQREVAKKGHSCFVSMLSPFGEIDKVNGIELNDEL